MTKQELKFMTIPEINALYSAESVAKQLIKKTFLYGQKVATKPQRTEAEKRSRTEAEKRHAMTVGRIARILAADRRAA